MPNLYACTEAWYCFQTAPKREHLAAVMLARETGVETCAPRIRFLKKTRTGKKPFVEALFPGYIFAHIALREKYRHAMSVHGIRRVVTYGNAVPTVPNGFIEAMKAHLASLTEEVIEAREPVLQTGDRVTVTEGPLAAWHGIVTGAIPARGRIKVLLELLGEFREVALPAQSLALETTETPHQRVWSGTGFRG